MYQVEVAYLAPDIAGSTAAALAEAIRRRVAAMLACSEELYQGHTRVIPGSEFNPPDLAIYIEYPPSVGVGPVTLQEVEESVLKISQATLPLQIGSPLRPTRVGLTMVPLDGVHTLVVLADLPAPPKLQLFGGAR